MEYQGVVPFWGMWEPFSSLSHLLGAAVALLAAPALLGRAGADRGRRRVLAVYVGSLVFLMLMSGLYHAHAPRDWAQPYFRRLDHAGIWIAIAGSFTPPHLILFRDWWWRYGVLALVWAAALAGVALKLFWFHSISGFTSLMLYTAICSVGLVSMRRVVQLYGTELAKPLYVGGVVMFAAGVLFATPIRVVVIPRLVERHELFHVLVVFGFVCHWAFVHRVAGGGVLLRRAPRPLPIWRKPRPAWMQALRARSGLRLARSARRIRPVVLGSGASGAGPFAPARRRPHPFI